MSPPPPTPTFKIDEQMSRQYVHVSSCLLMHSIRFKTNNLVAKKKKKTPQSHPQKQESCVHENQARAFPLSSRHNSSVLVFLQFFHLIKKSALVAGENLVIRKLFCLFQPCFDVKLWGNTGARPVLKNSRYCLTEFFFNEN